MAFENIEFSIKDGIARITLNRAERLNALNEPLLEEFAQALDQMERTTELRVLVLSGAGRAFCSGADLLGSLGSSASSKADIGLVLEQHYNPLIARLRSLQAPVVAIVNGVAAGAGVSFALAADIVLAAESARFVLAFARIGLVPDAGLSYLLSERIGLARALALALLGEEIDGRAAEQAGLIFKACPAAELSAVAEALVSRLANAPTRALALTKQAFYAAHDHKLAEQLHTERTFQASLGASEDFREGVDAFRNKRAARFVGR